MQHGYLMGVLSIARPFILYDIILTKLFALIYAYIQFNLFTDRPTHIAHSQCLGSCCTFPEGITRGL